MKTLFFILISTFSFGQFDYGSPYSNMVNLKMNLKKNFIYSFDFSTVTRSNIAKHGVKSISVSTTYKKSTSKRVAETDENGMVTAVTYFGKKADFTTLFTYINDTMLSSIVYNNKKGATISNLTYLGDKLLTFDLTQYGKRISHHDFNYEGDLLKQQIYIKKNNTYIIENEHDADGKKTASKYYKKGKLDREWVFTCDEEGKEVSQAKDLTQLCTYKEESNDGSYVRYTRRITDGKPLLFKAYFTADSTLYKSESFENDSIQLSSYTVTPTKKVYTSFKKGKEVYSYTTILDADGRIVSTSSFYIKNKYAYKTEYSYNDKGLLSTTKSYRKGKVVTTKTYSYTYY